MNGIARKFYALKSIIPGKIDVMIIGETKLDGSYPTSQFLIDGFAEPFRRDRNANGGGLLIYVREDIPCKPLNLHSFPDDIEGIFIELNFRKSKWLLFGTYHPPSQNDEYYFGCVSRALDIYSRSYDKFLLGGDFNAVETENVLGDFMSLYGLKNIVKSKTCFRSLENPSCIDIFLTNSALSFQGNTALSSGMSDCHKMVITVMKTTFQKVKARDVSYRSYTNFDDQQFKTELKSELSKIVGKAFKANINLNWYF